MICDTDELLLVAQKWMTESATVMFLFILTDESPAPILGVRLCGRVASIDRSMPGFSFVVRDEPVILVNLKDWKIGYADSNAIPLPAGENVAEWFTINRPNASISLWTLANQPSV